MNNEQPSAIGVFLDRIDPGRHDVDEVVRLLNEYQSLGPDEQDLFYEDGAEIGYAGVEPHPLTALCGEAHNQFFVLRDLDGSLQFVFEISPREQRWMSGPLYRGNLSEMDLEPYLLRKAPLGAIGIPLEPDEFEALLAALPDDPPGPLRSY
jgi:hypothetical protein